MPELPEVETVRRGLERINSWENHPVSGSKVSKDDSDGSGCSFDKISQAKKFGPWGAVGNTSCFI